jgi:hypothetical protein
VTDQTEPTDLPTESVDLPFAEESLPETEAPGRRSPGRVAALWLGIAALLAAGVFGIAFLAGDDEGSPEDAVRRMLKAIADEDVIGVMEALPPSEREPFQDGLPEVTKELQRLEVLSGGFRLEEVSGVDLSFKDIALRSREVGEGVSAVRITGGTASYRVEPKQLPLGDFITDLADLPDEVQSGSDAVSAEDSEDEIITILEDGRWYVSIYYSIAEAAREASEAPVPDFNADRDPKGGATPEKAVEELVRAGLELNVERAIELVDPKEGRALHDYAPLFIDSAKDAAEEADFEGTLQSIELNSERQGDGRAIVRLRKFAVSFRASDAEGTVTFDGECVTVTGADIPEDEGRICPDDAELPGPISDLVSGSPKTGIVVVERDGEWFVSPTRTIFAAIVDFVKLLDREKLDEFTDFFAGEGESEERFSQVGEAIETTPPGEPTDINDDGLIGGYTPEEFSQLSPEQQQQAYEEEFAEE